MEAVLISNPNTSRQAVTLMNWAYGVTAVRKICSQRGESEHFVKSHLPAKKVRVTIRIKGPVSKVRSVALDQDLQIASGAETITVSLPRLDEGDVLLLE